MAYKMVAWRINKLRKDKGMTQTAFGSEIGVTQATASRKLMGFIPFSLDEILRCAEMFGVSTDYIYGREEEGK